MKIKTHSLKMLALAASLMTATLAADAAPQVLVTIGKMQVTSDELNAAMASSPFSTQLASMDEKDQAGIRGDMLRRLVSARLLTLEARRLKLDKSKTFKQELENFRLGLLYRFYMDKLRDRIEIPADLQAEMKKQFKGDADGLAATRAAYIAKQYQPLKLATLQNLLLRDNTRLHEDRIKPGVKPDTVLMEGNSFKIRYRDIVDSKKHGSFPNPDWIKDQLYKRGELLLVAKAADQEKVDISAKLKDYESERLPALMMEVKTREWIPGEKTLHDWFAKHPEVAVIPERRHIGQLVVKIRKEAEALRARIVKGESLFTLAGKYSTDPFGREKNGDMGWVTAGRGLPALDQALAKLEDNQLSDVIETEGGFHLLMVLERKPQVQKSFADVRERIAQLIVNEKLPPYLGELEQRYQVSWKVIQARDAATAAGK